VDQELEARMRDLRAQGDGAFEKVRLLFALERMGRSNQAWDVGLGLVAARQDRGGEVREWLADLARREPAVVVPRIREARPALAREAVEILDVFSLEQPLVALALGEATPRTLRRLVQPVVDQRASKVLTPWPRWSLDYGGERIHSKIVTARRDRRFVLLPWLLVTMQPTGSLVSAAVEQAAREAWEDLAGGPPPFDEERFLAVAR
jgi:hypothetical protein